MGKDIKVGLFLVLFFTVLHAYSQKSHKISVNKTGSLEVIGKTGHLTVRRAGDALEWQGDTLAIITWWDTKGAEHSQSVSSGTGWITELKLIDHGYRLECRQPQLGFSFSMYFISKDDILTVSVPSSDIKEIGESKLKSMRLLPYFGAAQEGAKGYLAIAKEVGALCHFKDKKAEAHKLPIYKVNGINMPLFGMVRGKSGFAGIVTSGQFNGQFCMNTNWGAKHQYSIDTEFNLRAFKEENRLSDDLTLEYHFLSSDRASWAGIGKCYRQYNFAHRGIRPLKQRIAKSSELAYASEAMEVRLRLAVKPVPYKITEQTPETEPAVRAFLTFKQVRDIFDEFHNQGINQAEFCLVGWNIGGHDGRYPQLFPVESKLGGEDELRKTIKYGQSLGYQIVAHNCYWDAYRIANNWDESYLRKKADGQLLKGGQWGGGQSYLQCLSQSYELFAKHDLQKIKDLGFKGLHYTDVLSLVSPQPCYDPNHPETIRQDAEATNRILALSDSLIGGIQSEGPMDFTAKNLDRFIYTSIHPKGYSQTELPYIDMNVPLYATVYHGVITYNLDNRTFNSLPGEAEYLENIEYGGIPAEYFYGHFYMEGSDRKNWIGNRDYRYDSPEGLKQAVTGLKQVYDDLQKIKHLQMEFIEGHNQLTEGVFETIYGNGESVVVNYNDTPFRVVSGEEVPAKGFKLIQKNN